jgi:uncharacterized protein involved in exopolysaccharide biosynthesis
MMFRKPSNSVSILVALTLAGVGYAAWKLQPEKLKAQARLQVAAQIPKVLFQTVETEAANDYQRYQATQLTLVRSRLVLATALRASKVGNYRMVREQIDPIAWLKDNLNVGFIANSEVMEISLSGRDPEEMAGLVNAVTRAYMDEVVFYEQKLRVQRLDRLKKIKERYADKLKERRQALHSLTETVWGDERLRVGDDERAEVLRLDGGLWAQRVDLQRERAGVEARLAWCRGAGHAATDAARGEIDRLEGRRADLMAQEKVVDERLEQRAREARKSADQVPERERLKAEIAEMANTHHMVAAEIEALSVELEAPPRIRLIEEAAPPRPGGGAVAERLFGHAGP